jgi:hypothetical protein
MANNKIKQTYRAQKLGKLLLIVVVVSPIILMLIYAARSAKEKSQVSKVIVDCSSNELKADFKCWEKRVQAITEQQSVEAAITDLKKAYDDNSFVKSQCHPLVHRIGRTAVERYVTVSEAFKHGDSFCWSGYYHGVLETVSANLGRNKLVEGVNEICKDLRQANEYSFSHYNCVHGLGHGVMGITNNELFDSLDICSKLNDDWERQSCYGGVFMENVMSEINPISPTKYLNKDDPMYPCTAVGPKYKSQCYLMQSSYALKVDNYDFNKVFARCSKVDKEYVGVCYQSVGRDASGSTSSNVEATNRNCSMGPDEYSQINCITGAAKDFISYYHDDVKARAFCASFSKATLNSTCESVVSDYLKIL